MYYMQYLSSQCPYVSFQCPWKPHVTLPILLTYRFWNPEPKGDGVAQMRLLDPCSFNRRNLYLCTLP